VIRHIVLFRVQPEAADDAVSSVIAELAQLSVDVPGVIDLRVGRDVAHRGSFDIGLVCDFESPDALQAYLVHPAHVRVVKEVLPTAIQPGWEVVDVEWEPA
jgi:quinol monooxygenase YgiN